MTLDIVAVIGAATGVIGFLSVWIKMGVEKGESKKTMEMLERKINRLESDMAENKDAAHNVQVELARCMGRIEAKLDSIDKIEKKLDSISETVAALKGGRRAAEK